MNRTIKIIEEEYPKHISPQDMDNACQIIAKMLYMHWLNEGSPRPKKKLMAVKELAEYLAVSPKTIYQWTHLRAIPHTKLGGKIRFNIDRIDSWIDTNTKKIKRFRVE